MRPVRCVHFLPFSKQNAISRERIAVSAFGLRQPWGRACVRPIGDQLEAPPYSHSMLAGGLEVTSSTTRLARGTSLTMRSETRATRS